jgi:hypothetical protein
LAEQLERKLFDHGASVVRLREVPVTSQLIDAGLLVIATTSAPDVEALTIKSEGLNADQIMRELERLGALDSRDEVVEGEGI